MAEGSDVLSTQPKYGHFRREHHMQSPQPYCDANLSVLLVFTSPFPSLLLPVSFNTNYEVYKLYYYYSTLTFKGDLLSLASYHAWNPCVYRCEQRCMFVPELTNIMFAWPVIQNDAFSVITCDQLFRLWQLCLYFNRKANSHDFWAAQSHCSHKTMTNLCSLAINHLLGRNLHLSCRTKAQSWRLILTYFNLHTNRYSWADLELT